ncbi:MAG: hypothetical protein WKF57_06265 [Nakamurella sp.]
MDKTKGRTFAQRATVAILGGAIALSTALTLAPSAGAAANPTQAAASAPAPAVRGTLTLIGMPFIYESGSTVRFSGRVSTKGPRVLYIQRYDTPNKRWVNVNASRISDARGFYSVPVRVTQTTTYRSFAPAAPGLAAIGSAKSVRVNVEKTGGALTPSLVVTTDKTNVAKVTFKDAKGKPIANASISVYKFGIFYGQWGTTPAGNVRTNKAGQASFTHSASNTYFAVFFGEGQQQYSDSNIFN